MGTVIIISILILIIIISLIKTRIDKVDKHGWTRITDIDHESGHWALIDEIKQNDGTNYIYPENEIGELKRELKNLLGEDYEETATLCLAGIKEKVIQNKSDSGNFNALFVHLESHTNKITLANGKTFLLTKNIKKLLKYLETQWPHIVTNRNKSNLVMKPKRGYKLIKGHSRHIDNHEHGYFVMALLSGESKNDLKLAKTHLVNTKRGSKYKDIVAYCYHHQQCYT